MSFFGFYLSYFIFLTKFFPFQIVRNYVIEIQVENHFENQKNENHFQDSAISSP